MNTNMKIKTEPMEEDWIVTANMQEFETRDRNPFKSDIELKQEIGYSNDQSYTYYSNGAIQSPMIEDVVKVEEEIDLNTDTEKYLKMWKYLYPLVDNQTQRNIYKNNNGNISQTMTKLKQLNKVIDLKQEVYCSNKQVEDEIEVDENTEKYLKMWKRLYPLVDKQTQKNVYKNNNGNIRQTMAELKQLNKNKDGTKNNQCSHCDKNFSTIDMLISHLTDLENLKKIKEKPHKCSQCNKAFSKKIYLINHLKAHTGDVLKMHTIVHFSKKIYLINHLKAHTGDVLKMHTGEKPCQCSHCGKVFSWNSQLEQHLKTYRIKEPYQCSNCNKIFFMEMSN